MHQQQHPLHLHQQHQHQPIRYRKNSNPSPSIGIGASNSASMAYNSNGNNNDQLPQHLQQQQQQLLQQHQQHQQQQQQRHQQPFPQHPRSLSASSSSSDSAARKVGAGGLAARFAPPNTTLFVSLRRLTVYACLVLAACLVYLTYVKVSSPRSPAPAAPGGGGRVAASPLAPPDRAQSAAAAPAAAAAAGPSCPAGAAPASQYALMIDAGSTGSRIHVYKFTHCVDSASHKSLGNLVLDDELFEQLKPGLSSYGGDPIKAAKSLDPLLAKAKARVPVELWACTPIAVKATAGLRLLGVSESDAILKAIRTRLESMYPFNVVSDADNGVAVMDGKDEALFAWITVNYLRNSIGAAAPSDSESVAIMDLGGGSTQIVFEPKAGVTIVHNVEQHVEVTFGGRTYVVYQHSFLGYGLMEGRRKVLQAAIEKLDARLSCLGTGATMEIKNPGDSAGSKAGARVVEGTDEGFHQCQQFVGENLFSKDKTLCEVSTASCSWDGVYMPPLSSSFDGDIYAFSYFYDRIADLGVLPRGNEKEGFEFTISDVESLADAVCAAVDGKTAVLKELPKAVADAVESEPGLCLDLSFIYRMLRTGYELGQSRVLKTAKKINGVETGWCLGAAIHMVDAMIGGSRGVSGVCKAP